MPAAQRREVILAAAESTFADQGYHGASLDEIAHSAGVSKALIYEHFVSKRELHASLLHQHAGDIFERLKAGAERGQTGEQRLRSGIDAFLGFVEEHHAAWRAIFRDSAEPDVAELICSVQEQATLLIAALIAADPEAGGETGEDPGQRDLRIELYAQLLSGAVQSLATWWHGHPDVPRHVLVDRAMDFCWQGIERMPGRLPPVGSPGS
jgi:AcrR family transcriptional regulator